MTAVSSVLAGCGMTSKDKMEKAKDLLEEKYNEEFEVTEYRGQRVGESYYTVVAYSKEYPDLPFKVYVSDDGFSDEYIVRRFCAKLSDQIIDNMGLEEGVFVYTQSMLKSTHSTDPNIGVKEYASENPYDLYTVYFYIDRTAYDAEQIYDACVRGLKGLDSYSGNYIIQLAEDGKTIDSVQDYFTHSDGKYGDLDKIINVRNVPVNFKNGTVTTGRDSFIREAGEVR